MATSYPGAIDTFTNPTGGQVQGSTTPTHSGHHGNANDAIEAIETKLGTGSSTPGGVPGVLRASGSGSAWGEIVNVDVNASAAIAITKLAHVGANNILKSSGSANVAGQLVNADVSSSAAIAYSKLNLASSIATADLVANAVSQISQASVSTFGATTTSTSFSTLPEMSVTMTTTGGPLLALLIGTFSHSSAGEYVYLGLSLDGASEVGQLYTRAPTANYGFAMVTFNLFTGVSAASHTITGRWRTSAATASNDGFLRAMVVAEHKR